MLRVRGDFETGRSDVRLGGIRSSLARSLLWTEREHAGASAATGIELAL